MRLFISYAHVDKTIVKDWVVSKLVAGGHDVWFDDRLVAGQDWKQQLSDEIERSDALVYCMTPESVASDWCQWELARAVDLGKPVIPVLMQARTQLPNQLNTLQYVDFSDGPTGDAVARLMGGLQNLSPAQIPPAPADPKGTPAQVTDGNRKDDLLQSKKVFTRIPTLLIGFGGVLSIIILIVLATRVLNGGSVPTGTSVASNVRLENPTTERILAETSTPLIDNCGGSGAATRSLTRGRETTVSIELGTTIDIEASLVEVAKSNIQTQLSVTEGQTISSDDSVDVVVAPQSRVQYEVQWYETWQVGTLVFENTTIAIPYRVRVGYDADITGSQNQPCPGTTTVSPVSTANTQSPTATETEPPTEIPTETDTQTSIAPSNTPAAPVAPSATPSPTNGAVDFECPSGLGFNMVYIPSTTFLMGSDIGSSVERPIREVTVDAFCMDVFEVTNSQYQGCVLADVCDEPTRTNSSRLSDYYNERGDFPVIWVRWEQAQQYCEYQGQRAGLSGRLPTEAEWELVARFNSESPEAPFTFPWGRTIPDGSIHANFADSGIGDPIAVGQRSAGASAFGVQDLSGNVAEWVLDWYREGYNPTDILNPTGPTAQVDGQGRVVRGGSYNDSAEEIRGGYRTHSSVPQGTIGFRCIVQPDN